MAIVSERVGTCGEEAQQDGAAHPLGSSVWAKIFQATCGVVGSGGDLLLCGFGDFPSATWDGVVGGVGQEIANVFPEVGNVFANAVDEACGVPVGWDRGVHEFMGVGVARHAPDEFLIAGPMPNRVGRCKAMKMSASPATARAMCWNFPLHIA